MTPRGVKDGDLLIRDGRIAAVGGGVKTRAACELDAAGRYLAPGFLDLHVHGGAGADFSAGDRDAARTIAAFHAHHGTTGLLATIVPGPVKQMRKAMAAVADVPGILGIHLEGPFLNPDKAGALDPTWFLPPRGETFRELVAGFEGQIRVVTFAPELPGALDLIPEIRALGAIPAVGHSAATYEEATAAFGRGAAHTTHLGNAMSGLGHRGPGCVGAALLSRASLELVCDGIHVHPAFLRLVVGFLRGQGELKRLCLVSDATAAAGMPDGTYRWGEREVLLQHGKATLPDGTLAGSALTVGQALRNAIQFADLDLAEALSLVTANPARVLGWDAELGSLAVGSRADLVLLNPDLTVWAAVREGAFLGEVGPQCTTEHAGSQ